DRREIGRPPRQSARSRGPRARTAALGAGPALGGRGAAAPARVERRHHRGERVEVPARAVRGAGGTSPAGGGALLRGRDLDVGRAGGRVEPVGARGGGAGGGAGCAGGALCGAVAGAGDGSAGDLAGGWGLPAARSLLSAGAAGVHAGRRGGAGAAGAGAPLG